MSAPAEINMKNLNGTTWVMNKTLSDSVVPMLKMQGVSWLVQQAANYSTVTLKLKQYTDEEGVVHLDQEQITTGGLTSTEERKLNGVVGEKEAKFWGKVKGYSQFGDIAKIEDDWLREGWDQGTLDGDSVETYVESLTGGWDARTIWGFAEVDGARRHVRRVLSKKGKDTHKIKLVYDYST